MKIPFIFFLFIIPFKVYSTTTDHSFNEEQPTACQIVFSSSDLDHERYSEANLKYAMDGSNYRNIMSTYPILTKETERELFKLYKEQNSEWAFQILFLSNIRWVYSVVTRFWHVTGNNHDDLIQEGVVALLNAIQKFDLKKEVKLYTYAKILIFLSFRQIYRTK